MIGTPQVLKRLALDALAVEVVREFRRHGIEVILLKGRSIADRLYRDDPTSRMYGDVDLLVAPQHHEPAGQLLATLGFSYLLAGAREDEHCAHADTWVRHAGRDVVDLHHTLPGARADPGTVWSALSAQVRQLPIGKASVASLDDVGLALHVAMHAAQHGRYAAKPMADLRRALATFDLATITAAASLAASIDALPQFVTGLRLVPQGSALAQTLGHGVEIPAAMAVRALANARGTRSIALVLASPRWRSPLTIARNTFPSRTLLRRSMPLARRGWLGLAAAYAIRPIVMAAGLPAAVRAWRTHAHTWRG